VHHYTLNAAFVFQQLDYICFRPLAGQVADRYQAVGGLLTGVADARDARTRTEQQGLHSVAPRYQLVLDSAQ